MADSFTQKSSLSSDTAAYEVLAYFSLRPQLYFDAVADVKPTNQTHRGESVQFTIYSELSAATTALSETADPDAVAASDSTVVVTPLEYGNVLKTTAKLRAQSFLEIDSDVANLIGFNAGLSIDTLARAKVEAGTNVRYATGGSTTPSARNTVTPADTLAGADIRRARTDLVGANVMPNAGNMFRGFIHPDVSYDFRGETGGSTWRDPHVYSAPEQIWSGEIGAFEGVAFIETPRAPIFADGGSSPTTTDVYGTIITGKQALALAHANTEGYGRYPSIIKGPVVDALQRIQPIGWRWLGQYGRFREAALRRVESGSSVGS